MFVVKFIVDLLSNISISVFKGVAAVNLADPVAAVKELEKCVKEYGFKAVRVVPWFVSTTYLRTNRDHQDLKLSFPSGCGNFLQTTSCTIRYM